MLSTITDEKYSSLKAKYGNNLPGLEITVRNNSPRVENYIKFTQGRKIT